MQTIEHSYGTRQWYRVGLVVVNGPVQRGYYRQLQRGCGKYTPHQGKNEMERRRNR